jgi:DGQHR domain-containing protein
MSTGGVEDKVSFSFKALALRQPMGRFFIASMPSRRLCDIAYFDVRRMLKERDVETYLGIQRPLNPDRVRELDSYVRTTDACFPTAVILAIDGRSAEYDEATGLMTLSNDPAPEDGSAPVHYRHIAKVLDGQHRIAGLMDYDADDFEVNVSIFIEIDIEDQAYIFSTVNLAQTKVNKSLAYDLYELAKTPSPQKTCHNIAVALDKISKSPFHQRIKRLGAATPGRKGEMLTQATFIESLMPFISAEPMIDRDVLLRGNRLALPSPTELRRHPFRDLFVAGGDLKIADIVMNYFNAARSRWPIAWDSEERGMILSRTNGFRALMRVLMPAYKSLRPKMQVPDEQFFKELFDKVELEDKDFNSERFKPGTTGESDLYQALVQGMGLTAQLDLFAKS